MAWPKQGTVAVTLNSTTVTGTGTAFAANARVGDGFKGPDGAWYEITNIASDTVLSILPAYAGATGTGKAYAIVPVQGYDKALADAFNALVQQFGTQLGSNSFNALAALVGAPNKIPYFTDASNMALADLTALATIASPTFTGDPKAPTPATTDNDTSIATTAFVKAVVAALNIGNYAPILSPTFTGDPKAPTPTVGDNDTSIATTAFVQAAMAAFGLGSVTSNSVTDANAITAGGFYSLATVANNGVNGPPQIGAVGWTILNVSTSSTSRIQIASPQTSVAANKQRLFHRQFYGTVWSDWYEFAAGGANSDITSLTGLTTPLSVAQGGSGGTSQPFTRANSVGTVSQASGVPSGAIIETGTNTNGTYTKFADGTMICTKTIGVNSTGTYAVGSLFGSDAYSGTWPATFISKPFVSSGADSVGVNRDAIFASCYASWTTTSAGTWRGLSSTGVTAAAAIYLVAIGRWY